jgi:site-specific DNA-cytosine methylase
MAVLVACEESQVVTLALRARGVEAYSCDIEPCSGNHPEWHIRRDVRSLLSREWDAVIAFPPCTHLASSGARWFKEKRVDGRQQQGIDLFMDCVNANAPLVAVENPVGIMSSEYRKPDQIIQPWMFGHLETKATCLWLKGFQPLIATNNVKEDMMQLSPKEKHRIHYMPPSPDRARLRSQTYTGVADAIADQWFNKQEATPCKTS